MRWVSDRSGRFVQRPHYDPGELDVACESAVVDFLRRRGEVHFPLSTNDLTVFVEESVTDLDLYANLSEEGAEVQGVTDFSYGGGKPRVRVSAELTESHWRENRLRTTLSHELGHVVFHAPLFIVEQPDLFTNEDGQKSPRCNREAVEGAPGKDWMEWQANYASTAYLMPLTYVTTTARSVLGDVGKAVPGTPGAVKLVQAVAQSFGVSREAAGIRLQELGLLGGNPLQADLAL